MRGKDCLGLARGLEYLSPSLSPTFTKEGQHCLHYVAFRDSDSAQHAGDPPVARHDDLTDGAASHVVVGPRVETAQGLVVAAAVAVSTATVLAAVALVVQAVIQLDADVPLQKYQSRRRRDVTISGV